MRKITTKQFIAATSLALMFAAVGCTTNRYPGNGQPTMTTPGYGATNQSATPGSSYGNEGIPPMASSYTGIPQPNTDALAIAAAEQGFRGRVLGPANPGGVQLSVSPEVTGQVIPPAMVVNPQQTINATVSSPGVQGVSGGGGGGGGVVVSSAAAIGGSTVATAAGSPLVITGAVGVGATPASGVVVPAANATSPSISGNAIFAPQVMSGVVATRQTATTPAATSAINVGATPASGVVVPSATATSPTISGSATFAPAISSRVVTGTTRVTVPARLNTTTATVAKATTSRTATLAARDVGVGPIMVSTNANGQIVVSNVSATDNSTHSH
ncbi:MAG: hypothetical protein DMF59_02370 [Acidobacteria bacterium]|nr:MAG: hypothetical protein DMF59_02370 [Acidobacteriota bacterium]